MMVGQRFSGFDVVVPANKEKDPEITPREAAQNSGITDFKKMNGIRQRVDDTVKDAEVADLLKPWYRQFCKRPTFIDEFTTFNRENVTLAGTSINKGIDRITEKGIVANGVEYELVHYFRDRVPGWDRIYPQSGV